MITPARVHAIQYLALETPPLDVEGMICPEYHDLPQQWHISLGFLIADIDRARCENNCGTKIGYARSPDGRLIWRVSYLAKHDDHATVRLCEDCAPGCPSIGVPTTGWLPAGEPHA